MTKRNWNRLMRTVTFLLAIAMGVLSVAGGIAGIICYRTGMYNDLSKQKVLEQQYSRLQKYYEIKILEDIDNAGDKLKNTNLTYQIYEFPEDENSKESIPEGHVYSEADYPVYRSADGIIWNLMNRNYVFSTADNLTTTEYFHVNSIVYHALDGVFYYRIDNGYFPVREISFATKYEDSENDDETVDSSYLTYRLSLNTKSYICEDEKLEPLATDGYEQWTSAFFDGNELYTPCIISKAALTSNPFQETVANNAYSLEWTYNDELDDDELEGNTLLYIGNINSSSANIVSREDGTKAVFTHDGTKTLVEAHPQIAVKVEAPKPKQYVISSEVVSPLDMNKPDLFVKCTEVINALYPYRLIILYGTIIACGLFLVFLISCCRCTLRMKPDSEDEEDKPSVLARIPLLIYLSVMGGLLCLCITCFPYFLETWIEDPHSVINMNLALLIETVVIGFFCGMHILTNLCERVRTKTLRRYTVCHYLAKPFHRASGALKAHARQMQHFVIEHTSLLLRVGVVWIALFILQLLVISVTDYEVGTEIFLFLIYKLIEAAFIFIVIYQFNQLAKGGKELCEGDLSQKLDTSKLFGPFKRHAEHLNQIHDGIQIAVQERLKSEHFKTELITNVTHDIKTPLTSIINYVDLLRKDGITAEETNEYLEVLDRQSARLKKLIEDLIDASKASTGNMPVIFEPCDLEILLTQTLGEFEEKLLANHLELIIRNAAAKRGNSDEAKSEAIIISADNRHLWRIFDNLMNNICKYAQPHTRVYIDLNEEEEQATLVFRNTSRYPLDVDGDALLERFVRGDTSRNTEGNGLGLSIAKNLAELMGGKMKLYVDGDLFKVIITFPIKKMNEEQGK